MSASPKAISPGLSKLGSFSHRQSIRSSINKRIDLKELQKEPVEEMKEDQREEDEQSLHRSGSLLKKRIMFKKKASTKLLSFTGDPDQKKKPAQSNLLAQAPIKSRSNRRNFHRISSTTSPAAHFGNN